MTLENFFVINPDLVIPQETLIRAGFNPYGKVFDEIVKSLKTKPRTGHLKSLQAPHVFLNLRGPQGKGTITQDAALTLTHAQKSFVGRALVDFLRESSLLEKRDPGLERRIGCDPQHRKDRIRNDMTQRFFLMRKNLNVKMIEKSLMQIIRLPDVKKRAGSLKGAYFFQESRHLWL